MVAQGLGISALVQGLGLLAEAWFASSDWSGQACARSPAMDSGASSTVLEEFWLSGLRDL